MLNPDKENTAIHWDKTTKWILGIAGILIIFSFFAPYIFTGLAGKERFNFTKTGSIGDTLSGIMNPFIALAGILLTFLAFYMQIKANKLQIDLFIKGIAADKKKIKAAEQLDSYHKLMLLIEDLNAISDDISHKAERIKEYITSEREGGYYTHVLRRTANRNYSRILEIDRLSIFKAYKFFMADNESWRKDFSNMYNLLEFLPNQFDQIYAIADHHSNDIHQMKLRVISEMEAFIEKCLGLVTQYRSQFTADSYLIRPASRLCNGTVIAYNDVIKANLDDFGNPIAETDLAVIKDGVLHDFIEQALEQRQDFQTFDTRLDPIIAHAKLVRQFIHAIKNRMLETAENIEIEYNNLINDTDKRQSYQTELNNLKKTLVDAMENVDEDKIGE